MTKVKGMRFSKKIPRSEKQSGRSIIRAQREDGKEL